MTERFVLRPRSMAPVIRELVEELRRPRAAFPGQRAPVVLLPAGSYTLVDLLALVDAMENAGKGEG